MIKGDSPLSTSPYRLGTLTILAVVALRLAIGWHFYCEGRDKIIAGDFSTEGFMRIAKGPLTPVFQWMIWDKDGLYRLNEQATLDAWAQYRERVSRHYAFDEAQQAEATKIHATYETMLKNWFIVNHDDVYKYNKGLERRDRNQSLAERREVDSLKGQAETIAKELDKQRVGWMAEINSIWADYEADLNNLATEQQQRRGTLAIPQLGRKPLDTEFQNKVVPYFDLMVGILLVIGLATRLSALAGAGFLATIIATQWPGSPGAVPAYYQIIEMFALLVIAAVGAGRFYGLDFFFGPMVVRCCARKTEN